MHAALYVRVSSVKQADEGLSLPEQERRCKEFIAGRGWTLTDEHVFVERGVSGGKASRPELDALMEAVDGGEIEVVVTPKIDRLGRSARNNLELFDRFDAAGVTLYSPDGRDHTDKFIRTVESAIAERERENLSLRISAITDAKAARGSWHGGPIPFGYVKGEHGGLEVHDPHAKWVRYIFQRYAHDGLTPYKIAQELKDAKAPTSKGGLWTQRRVSSACDSRSTSASSRTISPESTRRW